MSLRQFSFNVTFRCLNIIYAIPLRELNFFMQVFGRWSGDQSLNSRHQNQMVIDQRLYPFGYWNILTGSKQSLHSYVKNEKSRSRVIIDLGIASDQQTSRENSTFQLFRPSYVNIYCVEKVKFSRRNCIRRSMLQVAKWGRFYHQLCSHLVTNTTELCNLLHKLLFYLKF